jgi:outer membrane protein OmpA-like peptidoglycan-associated protein/tetratricopeptide (TPR) repeat protein
MKTIKLLSVFAFIFINVACNAQEDISAHTKSKSAIKCFNKAIEYMEQGQKERAVDEANKAITYDANFLEAYLLLAEIYDFWGDFEASYKNYEKVFEIDATYDIYLSLKLAINSYNLAKYEEAKTYIDFYYDNADTAKNRTFDSFRLKRFIYFAENAYKNPVNFEPVNLGPGVNTSFDEYWPSLSADEEILVITRQIPINPNNPSRNQESMQEDLFVSTKNPETNTFAQAKPLPGDVNTKLNEGAQCISADGKTCIITACNRPDGVGSCDLYIMFLKNNKWTDPQCLKSVNSPGWDSNPTLSSDGKMLYFASSRGGGYGRTDIWQVEIDAQGNALSPVENIGKTINTEAEEVSPFIHPDGKTLYFASQGHPGMGDLDLFYSRMDDKNNWGTPKNIGYPINTNGEERSLIVNAKGDIAMFASTREQGKGLDIYYFEIPEEAKPVTVTYVKGYVYDIKTNKRLEADCQLLDLATGETVVELLSDDVTGEYMVCLPIDKDYAFNVSKKGYLFYSGNFSLTNLKNPEEPYILNIPLKPIEDGITVIMKNIFFDFNSFELLPESYVELNRVVEYMNTNPTMKIEIGGHTDNVGTQAYNKTLSENRAKSVYTYLIGKGIDKTRLSYKGYDFSMPIATNDTEEGRGLNRRTEFKVISTK